MSANNPHRRRSKHVATLELAPNQFVRFLRILRRGDVMLRVLLCFIAAVIMWAATQAWAPPFAYRLGDVPIRDVVARVSFEKVDEDLTEQMEQQVARDLPPIYSNDQEKLVRMRQLLQERLRELIAAESPEKVDDELWVEFWPEAADVPEGERAAVFADRWQIVKEAFSDDGANLEKLSTAISAAFTEFDSTGVLGDTLSHDAEDGSLTQITVVPMGQPENTRIAEVDLIRLDRVKSELAERIRSKLPQVIEQEPTRDTVAELVINWIRNNLTSTLTFKDALTAQAQLAAKEAVEDVTVELPAGTALARRGVPLTSTGTQLADLQLEHDAYVASMGWGGMLRYSLSAFGMYVAMYTLCGFYIYYRRPQLLSDLRQFTTLLAAVTVSVALAKLASRYNIRGEMIPLLLLGMTAAIAYKSELALLVSAATTLVVVLSLGLTLIDFVIILSSVATAILFLGDIRSRTKLIYVGAIAGVATVLTTLGVGTFGGQPAWALSKFALVFGLYSVLAGLLMTGLLPFIERLFQVQTDISLLELGDAAHPLLQELVRRAPGTYNHSINVASIAEAAADSIGAKGLLVRVGAYFHDIGKMFKPEYFVENQGLERNRHDTLLPAMSTLVIIAHVKDGADLARQHHLPQAIIDFIQQHHGTTLVEYFYRQASKQSEDDPDAGAVDETSFRYPGPKPQTKEAGVLMLADAVESASRALVDPTPARIESLVHELAMKRLLDGQFDACGLTLQDLRTIETSLIKSLTAVYHGRVKYPGQERA